MSTATPEMAQADRVYVDRTVKMLLWAYGGWKVMICGDDALGKNIAEAYQPAAPGVRRRVYGPCI